MLKHIDEFVPKDQEGRPASPSYFDELSKNVKWYHKVMLNRPLKVVLVMFILTVVTPLFVYLFLYQNIYVKNFVDDGYSIGICSHADIHRVQCTAEPVTELESACSPFCCYDPEDKFCYHRVPSRYSYISNTTWAEGKELRPRTQFVPYGNMRTRNRERIKLHIEEITTTHMKFIVYDSSKLIYPEMGNKVQNKTFTYKIYYPEVFLEIFSTNGTIKKPLLSTARGPFITAEDFWEMSLIISDEQLHGFGELNMKPKTVYDRINESNAYPFVMGQRNGSFHGIYVEHVGPLEMNYTNSNVISIKSLGGDEMAVHFFNGPKPEDVVKQFRNYIGEVTNVPLPYWSLGIHYCRGDVRGSKDLAKTLADFYQFSELALTKGVPYDSDCIADGIFHLINDEVTSTNLDFLNAIEYMNNNSINFLPTLRPYIAVNATDPIYQAAVDMNILLVNATSRNVYQGIFNNVTVAVPDYTNENTTLWLEKAWPFLNVIESLVLVDNWPGIITDIQSHNCSLRHFYLNNMINRTVCESIPWSLINPGTKQTHKNTHNKYGTEHVRAIRSILNKSRTANNNFIMSASSSAKVQSATYQQYTLTTWQTMKEHFARAAWSPMQGNYLHSVPVCGTHNTTADSVEALCIKWYLASVYLPIFRIQSNTVERHPFAFSGFANNILIRALKMRYRILPYIYGCLMEEKVLLRPMFYEFYLNNETYSLDEQFMVGKALLIAPNFRASNTNVRVYIPTNEIVYDLWGGEVIFDGQEESNWKEIPTLENEIVSLIRGGYIVPVQETTYATATETRNLSNITLIAALKHNTDDNTSLAEGYMYVSSGIKWMFRADEEAISLLDPPREPCDSTQSDSNVSPSTIIDKIRVYGLNNTYSNAGSYYEVKNLDFNICDYTNTAIIHKYIIS